MLEVYPILRSVVDQLVTPPVCRCAVAYAEPLRAYHHNLAVPPGPPAASLRLSSRLLFHDRVCSSILTTISLDNPVISNKPPRPHFRSVLAFSRQTCRPVACRHSHSSKTFEHLPNRSLAQPSLPKLSRGRHRASQSQQPVFSQPASYVFRIVSLTLLYTS